LALNAQESEKHELSIAQSIVDLGEHAALNGGRRILRISSQTEISGGRRRAEFCSMTARDTDSTGRRDLERVPVRTVRLLRVRFHPSSSGRLPCLRTRGSAMVAGDELGLRFSN
jgi:hypothetical protein